MEQDEEIGVYEEYRQRLVNNNADILRLEIYETFAGTGFIVCNTVDLVETLLYGDANEVIQELQEMKQNILNYTVDNRYSLKDLIVYFLAVEGYLLRIASPEGENIK